MCEYQSATLTVLVTRNSTVTLQPVTTRTYSGEPDPVSVTHAALLLDTDYTVQASVETLAGNVSTQITFGQCYDC